MNNVMIHAADRREAEAEGVEMIHAADRREAEGEGEGVETQTGVRLLTTEN